MTVDLLERTDQVSGEEQVYVTLTVAGANVYDWHEGRKIHKNILVLRALGFKELPRLRGPENLA